MKYTLNLERKKSHFVNKINVDGCQVSDKIGFYLTNLKFERNWVFASNSDILIPSFLKHNVVGLRYFKLWMMLDKIIKVWNT